jgi:uncharacterized protein YbjT (DUF2867 family)
MSKILITGASGNIGKSVIKHLFSHLKTSGSVFAGVRNPGKSILLMNIKIHIFHNV